MTNHRRFSARALACVAMLAGTLALAATAADAQTSNGGGNGGMGNMPGMSGMATAQSTSTRGSIFDLVRAAIATAPFHSLDVAQRFGGYRAEVADKAGITCTCIDPTARAEDDGRALPRTPGVNSTSTTTRTSTTPSTSASPSCWSTSPMAAGHFRLVALEYLILQKEWDATHTGPPSLFGQDFMLTDAGNRFGLAGLLLTPRVDLEVQPERHVRDVEPERPLPDVI